MNEQEIRDRIKVLETELKSLKSKLPKKERSKRQPIESNTSDSFMRMANKIVNAKRNTNYTTCRHCGYEKAECLAFTILCDKCGNKTNLMDTIRLK